MLTGGNVIADPTGMITADRIYISRATIESTGISVNVDGNVDDVELIYTITVPDEYNGRRFSSFYIQVQFEDESTATQTSTINSGGRHEITIVRTNLEEPMQQIDLQAIYVSNTSKPLVIFIDLDSFRKTARK